MKFWKSESKAILIVAAAALLLLPLLAALQYRWLGQVSEGEREQLKGNLRAMARRFSQDFDHELTLAYAAFSANTPESGDENLPDYAARYDRWQATSQHPQLVRTIFLAKLEEDDSLSLNRLDPETKQFAPSDWPEEMSGLHQRLTEHYRNISRAFSQSSRSQAPDTDQSVRDLLRRPFPPVTEEVPALVIPIMRPPVVKGNREISLRPSSGVVIVTLNQNYIQQELLPALARRHFDADKGLNYNIAIVSRNDARKVICQFGSPLSAISPDQEAAKADVTANLFGLRFDELRRLNSAVILRNRPPETEVQGRNDSAAAAGSSTPAPRSDQSAGPPPGGPNDDSKPWQLLIRHRAGSLDAAVTSVRRRNLILSFGILALLAVSVALMMLSSRRAQRLAKQQIEFVAGVSHELRTPLAVIRSAGENLADGVIRDGEQIKRYGKLIRDEGRRLTEMVEHVLEFAGTQSGRQKYELQPAGIGDLIEQALASSRQQIAEGGFRIEKEVQSGLPEVMADAPALTRAIQNLLSNAMKYSGESRRIGIKAQTVSDGKNPEVQITVEDHGLGIAPDQMSNIFEPFYRGNEVVAAQIHGNGLGLSLVKSIAEAHGGKVTVTSTLGSGSTFTICLPVASGTQSPESQDSQLSALSDQLSARPAGSSQRSVVSSQPESLAER